MTKDIANEDQVPFFGEDSFDALETGVRRQIRSFIELEAELEAALGRGPMIATTHRRDTDTGTAP